MGKQKRTELQISKIQKNFYNTTRKQALSSLYNVLRGSQNISNIYKYYFESVANDTKYYRCNYSVNDVLSSPELIKAVLKIIKKYPNYYVSDSVVENFRQHTRLSGNIAMAPSNFPYSECIRILRKYCPANGVYIDPSCGWGVRLLAAGYLNLTYVGFDVNDKLVPRLNELKEDIKRHKGFKCHIVHKGSEIYQPKLKNRGDLVMTSPPYFGLEDYGHGKGQSYRSGQSLEAWNKTFLRPMMVNMFKYLKPGRYCLINIKDYNKIPLVQSTIDAGLAAGFKHIGTDRLKNISRVSSNSVAHTGKRELIDMDEDIQIFFKEGKNAHLIKEELVDVPDIKINKLFTNEKTN